MTDGGYMSYSEKRPNIESMDYVFGFGKYKGWKLHEVLMGPGESYIEFLVKKKVLKVKPGLIIINGVDISTTPTD